MRVSHSDVRLSRRSRVEELTAEQAFYVGREHFLSSLPRLTASTFVALLHRAVAGGHEEAAWVLDVMKRTRYSSQQDLPSIVKLMSDLLTSGRSKDVSPRGLFYNIKYVNSRLSDADAGRLQESAEGGYVIFG